MEEETLRKLVFSVKTKNLGDIRDIVEQSGQAASKEQQKEVLGIAIDRGSEEVVKELLDAFNVHDDVFR